MNFSVFRFTLNMHNHRSQISIPVFYGDTAVKLYISITDGVNIYNIEDGCIAVLSGKKADGNTFKNSCTIEENTRVVYEFTDQTTNHEGIVNCDLTLYGPDGKIITAPKFVLVVDERVSYDDDVPISDNEKTALDKVFSNEASRIVAENERVDAEDARKDAEDTRIAAEDERVTSEINRNEAETARALNETKRVEAEQARAEAEKGRVGFIKETAKKALDEAKEYTDRVSANNDTIFKIERRVTNLENQLNPEFFLTDSTASHIKTVPGNACPYAQLNSIGGMTVTEQVHPDTEGAIATNVVSMNDSYNSSDSRLTCTYANGLLTVVASGVSEDNPASLHIEMYLDNPYLKGYYKLDVDTDIPNLETINDSYGRDLPLKTIAEFGENNNEIQYGVRIVTDIKADGTYYVKPRLYKYELMTDNKPTAIKIGDKVIELPEDVKNAITGKGINAEYADIVDFENNKVITKMKTIYLKDYYFMGASYSNTVSTNKFISDTGLINFYNYDINDFIPNSELIPLYFCSHLPVNTDWKGFTEGAVYVRMSNGNHYFSIVLPIDKLGITEDMNYTQIRDKVAQWITDNDVTITYPVSTPTETAFTTDFDNIIEVEAGGSIEFVNERNANIPSSITYMLKEV